MISSRKCQFVIVLILTCIFVPVFGAEPNEPNEPKTELKFETSNEEKYWISGPGEVAGIGPIKPTHVAEVLIQGRISYYSFTSKKGATIAGRTWNFPGSDGINMLLRTSDGRSMTLKQRDFLAVSDAIADMGYDNKVRNYSEYRLYAVSGADAEKMVKAFLEILGEKNRKFKQECEEHLRDAQERIANAKKALPEKRTQAKEAGYKYKEAKKNRYSSLSEDEARDKAKQTMLQMDNRLDILKIELAGIQEKLNSIEKYRRKKYAEDAKNFSRETLDKLDQMYIEQMIELRSVEARKEATLRIRSREKTFLDFYENWIKLDREVRGLEGSLKSFEGDIQKFEKMLANPIPGMRAPEVYKNTATIYPVRVEDKKQNDAIKVRLF